MGQLVYASSSAFTPSLLHRLLQKYPSASESWTDWDASCMAREWGSLQQKRSTNLCEYDNHSYVEGCYEETILAPTANARFQRKTFGWSVILPQVLAGS